MLGRVYICSSTVFYLAIGQQSIGQSLSRHGGSSTVRLQQQSIGQSLSRHKIGRSFGGSSVSNQLVNHSLGMAAAPQFGRLAAINRSITLSAQDGSVARRQLHRSVAWQQSISRSLSRHKMGWHKMGWHKMGRHKMGRHMLGWHKMGRHKMGRHKMGRHKMGRHKMGRHKMGRHKMGRHKMGRSLGGSSTGWSLGAINWSITLSAQNGSVAMRQLHRSVATCGSSTGCSLGR
jgi:hypothetical protein